jgi:hypothetical protein
VAPHRRSVIPRHHRCDKHPAGGLAASAVRHCGSKVSAHFADPRKNMKAGSAVTRSGLPVHHRWQSQAPPFDCAHIIAPPRARVNSRVPIRSAFG